MEVCNQYYRSGALLLVGSVDYGNSTSRGTGETQSVQDIHATLAACGNHDDASENLVHGPVCICDDRGPETTLTTPPAAPAPTRCAWPVSWSRSRIPVPGRGTIAERGT